VPIERCGVRKKFVAARYKQGLAMHRIVVSSVFELLMYAWANLKNMLWHSCDVAMIE
jgi:hypothetical protein